MTDSERKYKVHPEKQRWTHLALHVNDIDKSVDWYLKHTHFNILDRREDEDSRAAWLGDSSLVHDPFILVLAQFLEGKDPFAPVEHPILAPFNHIGIEVTERHMIDDIAAAAKEEGCLALGPMERPAPVGYICFIKDPDGNTIEFSFDQGVYEKAKEVWGDKAVS